VIANALKGRCGARLHGIPSHALKRYIHTVPCRQRLGALAFRWICASVWRRLHKICGNAGAVIIAKTPYGTCQLVRWATPDAGRVPPVWFGFSHASPRSPRAHPARRHLCVRPCAGYLEGQPESAQRQILGRERVDRDFGFLLSAREFKICWLPPINRTVVRIIPRYGDVFPSHRRSRYRGPDFQDRGPTQPILFRSN